MNLQLNTLVKQCAEANEQRRRDEALAKRKAFEERIKSTFAKFSQDLSESTGLVELLNLDLNTIETTGEKHDQYDWPMFAYGRIHAELHGRNYPVAITLIQRYRADLVQYQSADLQMSCEGQAYSFTARLPVHDNESIIAHAVSAWNRFADHIRSKPAIERKKRLAAAYDQAFAAWQESCRVWAEENTARLWQPWEAWEVRYTPLILPVDTEDTLSALAPHLIMTIVTRNNLAEMIDVRFGANVVTIGQDGSCTERIIGAYLDATPKLFDAPTIETGLNYHRHYKAGNYVVNVPPHVIDKPTPAPVKPTRPPELDADDEDMPF